MKTITIELTDSEYKDIIDLANQTSIDSEDYIVIATRLYKPTYDKTISLRKTIEEDRIYIAQIEHRWRKSLEKIKDLQKENKILKQNLQIEN